MMSGPELPPLLLSLASLLLIAWWHLLDQQRAQALTRYLRGSEARGSRPVTNRLQATVGRLLSPAAVQADALRLLRAGIEMPGEALWIYRMAAGAAGSVLTSAGAAAVGAARPGVFAAIGAAVGMLGVDWWLDRRTQRRCAMLRRDWPGFLYRLRLCLLAGMPLASSLEAILSLHRDQSSPVHSDLVKVVRKVKAGLPCEAALVEWAEAAGAGEVAALAGAVERSRSAGVPLAATIEMHHRSARSRHRFAYTAWLNGLPGRLSTVAMVFFLPAVLVIVLIPNVIAFLRASW